ncbi:MAG: AAA family ATPase, partial [Acidobacteriota bacterium]
QGFEEFTRPRKVAWIIKRLLPRASLGVLFGATGAGKSFLVLDLVAAVARGIDWCGHRIAARHRVVYVTAEGQEDFRRRASAYALAAGTVGQPNGGMGLYFVDEAPNLLEVGDARELARQIAACPGGKPALVVLDTLAQVMVGGNENSSEDVGKVLKHCRLIERATGAMVLLVAHTGKDETRGLRGWSGVRGAADFEMEVVREGHDRVATLTKLKGGEEGLAFPFRLKPVVLGQDEDGDDITSCVVEHVQEMPERHLDAKSLAQQAVLQSLEQIHAMTDEWPTQNELLQVAASKLPEEEDGRDRRRSSCSRALSTYISRGEIVRDAQGRLHVARRGEQPLP